MPSKSQLFSAVFNEVTKGISGLGQNQNKSRGQQYADRGGSQQGSATNYYPSQMNNQAGGYNPQQGGYPPPQQGGYPPPQQGGYPPQQGGYPPPQQGGYPPPQQGGGYPPQQSGYPPQGPPGGPPGQSNYNPSGYPGQGGQPGYPGQNSQSGYPGQNTQSGYPGQNSQSGYPGQAGNPGQQSQTPYPPQQPFGQPPAPGFQPNVASQGGSNPGYPPQAPQQSGYPPQQSGYPPQQGGYPPQGGGYPPQQTGYPGQQPSQNPGYGQGYAAAGYANLGGAQNSPAVQNFNYSPASNMRGNPSVRPHQPFNAQSDAEILRKAMKGLGCDKTKIVMILCARTNAQRQQIAVAFKSMYGKDLIKDLKSELSGDFEDLIIALMDPPAKYDAQQLYKAMAGLGTKESVLIEIMCSRTNAEIMELRNVYRQLYRSDLERDLVGETSGYFKRLLISMCAAGRDESMHVDPLKANQDARALYQAGEQRLGTDEARFNSIIAAQNYAQLRLVFQEYQKSTNHSIEKAIETEFSGDIRDGLMAIIACVQNQAGYFAKLLYDSMAGMGTRDTDLIRIIVTRSEVDLADIRQQFQILYKKSLEAMIKGDCSGAYKDGLIALVKGN